MSVASNACARVLVVDDEPDLLTLYELALLREGHQVSTANSVQSAKEQLQSQYFDVLVTDMRLPDGQGLDLVAQIHSLQRPEKSVVITAYGSAENAVQALKLGAFDYLTKPVDLQQFRAVVRDAAISSGPSTQASPIAKAKAQANTSKAPSNASAATSAPLLAAERLIGRSQLMDNVRQRARKVAVSMAPVLVRGESGTGKEVLARAIHDMSHRASGPFVAVNCGAIPEALLEAEFFGARKGAYTGAQQDREGFFQAAQGGTLFLDEIGDLPLTMQSKLLRAIQERCIRPLGTTTEVPVDVRILSATHKKLEQEVAQGRFRQDLYYRLNVIELTLPPLRERREDLPELAQCLIERIARLGGAPRGLRPRLQDNDLQLLQTYDFPGNVRELENLLHRALTLSDGDHLALGDAMALCRQTSAQESSPATQTTPAAPLLGRGPSQGEPPPPSPEELKPKSETSPEEDSVFVPDNLEDYLNQQERRILLKVLQDTDFNRTAAAQRLGISLRQIRYRMERLHIQVPGAREEFADTLSGTAVYASPKA